MPLNLTDPQLGPAMALVALRTEYPTLPPVKWELGSDGHLMGTCYDPDVFALYAEALAATPTSLNRSQRDGVIRESRQLFVTWRDVEISLWLNYIVGTVSLKAVA
jgi:hypothetical protein